MEWPQDTSRAVSIGLIYSSLKLAYPQVINVSLIHGGGHRCRATGSGLELECSSQEHNHRRGALNWQVLFWTAGTKLAPVSKPADRSCIPSAGVSSCWRCLPCPVNVQGRWRKFRYLYARDPNVLTLLTITRDRGGDRSVLREPVCLRGQQTHRPPRVQDRAPGPWRPPSAAWRGPLRPGTER